MAGRFAGVSTLHEARWTEAKKLECVGAVGTQTTKKEKTMIDPDNLRETPGYLDTSVFEESSPTARYEGPEEDEEE